MKKLTKATLSSLTVAALLLTPVLEANANPKKGPKLEYDQNVTPEVIFGSGNANGNFTTDRRNGIEIGIRAKVPFVGTVNSNGDGTYSYSLLETDHDGNPATALRWNFDWTVNTDSDGSSGLLLDDLTYELGMDGDPGPGTNFVTFDPITPSVMAPFYDHSIGDNFTANGAGADAGDAVTYSGLLASKNVLQQSWRYAFFAVFPPLDSYDPDASGIYNVYLLARDANGHVLARSDIQVLIGDLPTEASDCKKGGWMTFSPLFKNQGDCVSFVKNGK